MTLSNYLDKAILGAAVGPQDRSHLVHLGQFDNCATAIGYAPPIPGRLNRSLKTLTKVKAISAVQLHAQS